MAKYEPLKQEPEILKYWEEKKIYENIKLRNNDGKKFYYLDGPPYTSGKVHLGTAWGKALRDSVMRYLRAKGYNVWDRAGFDTHGLPTENAVMKKLGLKNKDEIPNKFGVKEYVEECKNFCEENKDAMIQDFKRLGVWMGFEDPYITLDRRYMEAEWWLIKKAHENNRLYEGMKVMHWCPRCGTSLAKHELEYNNVTDDSIFLKFKVKGTDNEYLVIWTTTPWTIPYNLGVMVNPEEEYLKAKVGDEIWIVAAKLAGMFIRSVANADYTVVDTFLGEKLENVEYIHPLYDELKEHYDSIKKDAPAALTVVLSTEYVDTGSGSGLVHMAPGCGPEDYEVGHFYHIPPFNNLEEDGSFPKNMGPFAGWVAKVDDKKFIEYFKKKGILIETTPVEHEYPGCWRCHEGVVFRLTKQWFFKIEDLKEKMRELNKNIYWVPDWAGNRQFDSWLNNLRDNSITRQRFWGCAVPIWKCHTCESIEVIGSVKELEEKSGKKAPEDLHIPVIDSVKLPCKCGKEMVREPDILDVWVDAGIASWACLDYPQREDLFKEWWPTDFILEGKDQIRGWFNLLFVASMVSMELPSYKAVYMHGFINDAQGRKMSKSLGNYILPKEVIDKYGADTLRYYSIGGANPGLDLNYNFDDMEIKHRNLNVLWNLHNFVLQLAKESKIDLKIEEPGIEESYILSRLHSTIKNVTKIYDEFRVNEAPGAVEALYLDLSRTYVQLVRDKAAIGSEEEKKLVANTIALVLLESLKMLAPVVPFITEQMYLNLKDALNLEKDSIHEYMWPEFEPVLIDENLEKNVEIMGDVVQAILSGREKIQLGQRWPLKEVVVTTSNKDVTAAVEELRALIMTQTNVKNVVVSNKLEGVEESVKPDYAKLQPDFKEKSAKIIAHLSTTSPETIMKHVKEKGFYDVSVDGEKFAINRSHLITERIVPEPYKDVDFRYGVVYLDTERNLELDSEGYSRELMRRVQALRKNIGLEKKDKVDLYIKADSELVQMFLVHEDMIKDKCGASKVTISEKHGREYQHTAKEKVKGKEFEVMVEKV